MALLTLSGPATPLPEGEEPGTPYTFLVTWSGPADTAAWFLWSVAGTEAEPTEPAVPGDFAGGPRHPTTGMPIGAIRLVAGETTELTIPILGNAEIGPSKGFTLTLSGEGETASATAIIADDDSPLPGLVLTGQIVDRGEGTSADGYSLYTFLVTRSGDLSGASSVGWQLVGDGENPATQYDFRSGTYGGWLSFAPGESEALIKVRVLRDSVIEPDEGFAVVLVNPEQAKVVQGRAAAVIRNDDFAVTVTPLLSDREEGTGDGVAVFSYLVTRIGDVSAPCSVTWETFGSAAEPGLQAATGEDFLGGVMPRGVVHFAAGETSAIIKVRVLRDAEPEYDEGFGLRVDRPSPVVYGVIRNDDQLAPLLSISGILDDRAEDADAGQVDPDGVPLDYTAFTYRVTRSGDLSEGSSFGWVVSGTGTNPINEIDIPGWSRSGSGWMAPGVAEVTITIRVFMDNQAEADEQFLVSLTGPSAGPQGSALGTIRDDDGPAVSLSAEVTEQDEGTGPGVTVFTYLVTRSGDLSGESRIDWGIDTFVGMRVDTDDFLGGVLPSGTLVFAPGEASKTIEVNVLRDDAAEIDEDFVLRLVNPTGAAIVYDAVRSVIRNDDRGPTWLTIEGIVDDRAEGTGDGVAVFSFLVRREGDLSGVSSVTWRASGSGENPAGVGDAEELAYYGRSRTLTFAAGESEKIVKLRVQRDNQVEADETFTVSLENPVGAGLVGGQATGVIRNDDFALSNLRVVAVRDEGAEGTGAGVSVYSWQVVREGDLRGTVQLDWQGIGLGADAADFLGSVLPSGRLVFAPGVTEQTIKMRVLRDGAAEGDEAFALALSGVRGATLGEDLFLGLIRDDDAPPAMLLADHALIG
ncbi:Calx-beta domain-containing protein [Falsiroseomonas sp.]|uniref:Calx-beta domain-containing protein n=1 Tax=Falsiroseomonas sp. TaxID=2870721 RepID=UPI003F71B93F